MATTTPVIHTPTYAAPERDYGKQVVMFTCACGHHGGGCDKDPAQAQKYAEEVFNAHLKHMTKEQPCALPCCRRHRG